MLNFPPTGRRSPSTEFRISIPSSVQPKVKLSCQGDGLIEPNNGDRLAVSDGLVQIA